MAAILDEVRRFGPQEQRDDITLIVATWGPRYSKWSAPRPSRVEEC
jgi:hypothetical protein